nr:restriction endonuclease subunit S [uncultured Limnohabitans sp.]
MCSYNDEVLSETVGDDYEIEYVDIGSVSAIDGISGTETLLFGDAPSRARRIVRDGDILISTVRTYLEAIASVQAPPNNLIASTGFAVIRPNAFLHKGYAAYCLRASGFIKEVVARSVGVSYPAINASDLVNIKTPEPSPTEQENIAAFLDHETAKIDALIEKQQRLIELLKEKRQAVISHAVTKGLNPNAPMKDSGVEWLGYMPAHWSKIPLKAVIKTRKGIAFKSDDFTDQGIRVVKASDIKERTIRISDVFLPVSFIQRFPKAVLSKGDIVLSTVGSNPDVKNSAVGQLGMLPKELDGALLNQNTVVFDPNEKVITKHYLFNLIQTTGYRDHLDLHAHGTANQSSLNIENMLDFVVCIPSIVEQLAICVFLSEVQNKLSLLEEKANASMLLLQERRTSLISAAVTGKIDVRDWQAAA